MYHQFKKISDLKNNLKIFIKIMNFYFFVYNFVLDLKIRTVICSVLQNQNKIEKIPLYFAILPKTQKFKN